MSRRHRAKKQVIYPDAKYADIMVSKFINTIIFSGKKSIAEQIVYGAFDIMKEKTTEDAVKLFHSAVANVRPHLEVRSRRVGGATYQVPMEVRPERGQALAFRWIIAMARKRSEGTMKERLAAELIDALHERGASIKKREDTHKMAEANRAFAHYRW